MVNLCWCNVFLHAILLAALLTTHRAPVSPQAHLSISEIADSLKCFCFERCNRRVIVPRLDTRQVSRVRSSGDSSRDLLQIRQAQICLVPMFGRNIVAVCSGYLSASAAMIANGAIDLAYLVLLRFLEVYP